MWSILSKANNVIQTLCILYELYKVVKEHIVQPARTALKKVGQNTAKAVQKTGRVKQYA